MRNYWLLCLGALLAITLTLGLRGLGVWSLFPMLVGSLGLALRWRSGPAWALVALGGVLYSERTGLTPLDLLEGLFTLLMNLVRPLPQPLAPPRRGFGMGGRFQFADMLLCAAALAYLAAHYRLVGLSAQLFPRDPRRPSGPPSGWAHSNQIEARRSEQAVAPQEAALLAATVPGWVGLGAVAWAWLMERRPPVLEWPSPFWREIYPELARRGDRLFIDLPPTLWRAVVLVWLAGAALIVIGGFIHYLGWRRLSPPEAALFLQDELWRETCREQRLLGRWLVRRRLHRRRKEKP